MPKASQTPTTDAIVAELNKLRSSTLSYPCEQRLLGHARELENALRLHLAFLDSLPQGWLGRTVADIGLLNEAYIASRAAGIEITPKTVPAPKARGGKKAPAKRTIPNPARKRGHRSKVVWLE